MPYSKLFPADPQPVPEDSANAVLLPNGEWWLPAVLLETGEWIAPDEVAVELDTGERIALACIAASRDFARQTVYLTTTARVMDAEGGTALDRGQDPAHIATTWIHGVTISAISAAGGLDAIRTECLRIALGEPPTLVDGFPLVPVSDAVREAASIRRAIAAAAALDIANLSGSNGLL